jgi:CHAT domain-containing protein
MKLVIVAVATILLISSPANAQNRKDDICAEVVDDVVGTRTHFVDQGHRAISNASRTALNERATQSLIAQIKSRHQAELRANRHENAVVIQLELLRLHSDLVTKAERSAIIASTLRYFQNPVSSAAAAEALLIFAHVDLSPTDASDLGPTQTRRRADMLAFAIAEHRRFFGPSIRQSHVWIRLLANTNDPDRKLAVARDFRRHAEALRSPSILREASLRLAAVLPTSDASFPALAREIGQGLAQARNTPLPAGELLSAACFSHFARHHTAVAKAVGFTDGADARRRFLREALRHFSQTFVFAVHSPFVLEDIAPILASRSDDYDEYLQALAQIEPPFDHCKNSPNETLICNLLRLGEVLVDTHEPLLALQILQDANLVSERDGVSPQARLHAGINHAEAQWKFGRKALAVNFIAKHGAQFSKSADPQDILKFHSLHADIAEAQLNPAQAEASFSAILDQSIDMNKDEDHRLAAGAAAENLTMRYLRKAFCLACSTRLRDKVSNWILRRQEDGYDPNAAKSYLMHRILAGPSDPTTLVLERRLRQYFSKFGSRQDQGRKQNAPAFARESPLTLAAMASLGASGTEAEVYPLTLAFLKETDPRKMRRLWDQLVGRSLAAIGEDGFTEGLQDTVDLQSRYFAAAGYWDASRVVLEYIADHLGIDFSSSQPIDANIVRRVRPRAVFWSSIHARLAAHAAGKKQWDRANRHLDIVSQIVSARLDEQWSAGADQIGPLLREFRDILRLSAQIRLTAALAPENSDKRNAAVFEELQLAMIGETAANFQSAQRRRLIAAPQLAQAVEAQHQNRATLELLAALKEAVGVFDEDRHAEQARQARADLDSASRLLGRLLPEGDAVASLRPLTLSHALSLLNDEDALLLLHAGTDAIYGAFVSKSGPPTFWRNPITAAALEKSVRTLRDGLDVRTDDLPVFPFETARNLFQVVLGPVREQLDRTSNIFLLADGALLSFPLSVLPTETPGRLPANDDDYRAAGIKWLGHSHAISTLPYMRSLEARSRRTFESQAPKPFIGIGNPVLVGPDNAGRGIDYSLLFRQGFFADVDIIRKQSPLPETEAEIKTIARLTAATSDDLFLGPQATEQQVKRNGLSDYRIIMFATHGVMGGELTGMSEPGLILTPPDVASLEDDGLLTASEIVVLKLDAELVVLSACNTAASDGRPRADGLSGLTRSFLSAGARNVLVTHWTIPSLPAVAVTTQMMAERSSDPKISWAEALRRAKKATAENSGPPAFAHPSNWAAFAIVGAH